jgi:hypothetical protein
LAFASGYLPAIVIVTPPPQPVFLAPILAGANIHLNWTAVPNIIYRIEFNEDLNSTNWIALPGDVPAASDSASKQDALSSLHRFYRVRALP